MTANIHWRYGPADRPDLESYVRGIADALPEDTALECWFGDDGDLYALVKVSTMVRLLPDADWTPALGFKVGQSMRATMAAQLRRFE